MICKNCGRELHGTDKFCGMCGTPSPLFENIEPVREYMPDNRMYTEPVQEEKHDVGEEAEPVQEQTHDVGEETEPVQEQTHDVGADAKPVWENTPNTGAGAEPVREHTPNSWAGAEPAQAYIPYTQPNNMPPPEYRPYRQTGNPNQMPMSGKKEKVKRTCSLSAVIFCAIVIFLLSVACGIFAGLYFSVKPVSIAAPYSVTEYADCRES